MNVNVFTAVSTVLAAALYFPLCRQIKTKEGADQNLLTWVLWAGLDGLAAATLIVQNGSFFLPLTYAIGSSATAISIWMYWEKVQAGMV